MPAYRVRFNGTTATFTTGEEFEVGKWTALVTTDSVYIIDGCPPRPIMSGGNFRKCRHLQDLNRSSFEDADLNAFIAYAAQYEDRGLPTLVAAYKAWGDVQGLNA
jgi:hypothetical protein